MSTDERRCFSYFRAHTVPAMVGWFDSEIWQRLVLQMAQADPAVCHAVAALSALHEASSRGQGAWDPRRHQQFALEQYGKSISLLSKRLRSNDPCLRQVVLVCCLAFIFIEYLQGRYDHAFTHLANALHILTNHRGAVARSSLLTKVLCDSSSDHRSTDESALLKVFTHVDVQSAHFGAKTSLPDLSLAIASLTDVVHQGVVFTSIVDAKQKLDSVFNNILRFRTTCAPLLHDPTTDLLHLAVETEKMRSQLQAHIAAFDELLARYPNPTPKEARSIDIIRLHHLVGTVDLDTVLDPLETVYDSCLPRVRKFVDISERVIASLKAEYKDRPLPELMMDLGVIAPLGWVSLRCRDRETRQRALDLLQAWPHREGSYDSRFFVLVASQIMAIENEGADPNGYIPEQSRIRFWSLDMAPDRRSAVLNYQLSDLQGETQVCQRELNLVKSAKLQTSNI
ncbi:hypothetical protein ASPZODRAFT_128936 [Penicilliopsis zonata CBS 506.65]|uniref:C6 zinc finger domain protein n=1 Tax=Penicilliopsis zonata CBS 506.65 TaxID=1073090 RepID=A0A1L9SSY2_9EURO|nr:hypothetical protein ASPZODRAFT_128936 [Penicilliopsis zonata CBS 506.65]OJJ50320.1 hypothetical protein ASPZODRAFT_128936 [Penicilliopsis zonata CBS 506.65]